MKNSIMGNFPEDFYNNMMEYIQDKYATLSKDITITGKRKEFIKDQNLKLNGSDSNHRDALLLGSRPHILSRKKI